MNRQGLNGIVPCRIDKCGNIASVLAHYKTGLFYSAYFCNEHVPEGWEIAEGVLGSTGLDILRRNT
jgi:hypothetical protein